MLPHELERLAAQHVPGGGTIALAPLGRGLVYETYRARRDGRVYALRVPAAASLDAGIDRRWEARVLESAALATLAPPLEYYDPQAGILVTRWVEGRSWSAADARRPANLSRMAELLRRVHALPVPAPPRLMTPAQWIGRYAAGIAGRAGMAARVAAAPADGGSGAELRDAAAVRLATLAALPSGPAVVCHSDLHLLNLIDRGPALVLLDWEYAHVAEPLWDLAGWGANNDFEDSLRLALLREYLGRNPTDDEYSRLRVLGWLYDYVCLLWSELYLKIAAAAGGGPGDPRGEVRARAVQLAERLHASADDPAPP